MTAMLPADSADDVWLAARRETLSRTAGAPYADTRGRVERVGDGIAFVSGLADAALNELLRFESGASGFVHTLEADLMSVVLLDDDATVEAGASVTRTGAALEVRSAGRSIATNRCPRRRACRWKERRRPSSHAIWSASLSKPAC
jgi:F-type H+-transporting ATPase subunit alpha